MVVAWLGNRKTSVPECTAHKVLNTFFVNKNSPGLGEVKGVKLKYVWCFFPKNYICKAHEPHLQECMQLYWNQSFVKKKTSSGFVLFSGCGFCWQGWYLLSTHKWCEQPSGLLWHISGQAKVMVRKGNIYAAIGKHVKFPSRIFWSLTTIQEFQ